MLHKRSSPLNRGSPPPDTERSDRCARLEEALTRTGSEDREAFRTVYTLTCNKLFGICLRVCGKKAAAEDVLAEVYLTIWKRAGAWEPERGSANAWLSTIARNRAIDWRRRHARVIEVRGDILNLSDPEPGTEALLLSAETERHVRRCLDALVPQQQAAIRSAIFDGLTYAELAARSGVPLSTMKSIVRRALLRMKDQMDRDNLASGEPELQTILRVRQQSQNALA